jgi:hypothetical protein
VVRDRRGLERAQEAAAVISREDMVTQSVQDYVRAALVARGYELPGMVRLLDSFPYERREEGLDCQLVALGFDFDDEGEQAELGSDLMRRSYTIELFVFGTTNTWARNLANVMKFAVQNEGTIPLKDVSQPGAPVIDRLEVLGASAERQVIRDPQPWQQYVWTTVIRVQDVYHASLV